MKKKNGNLDLSNQDFDFASFEQEAISGLQRGGGLVGTNGVLTSMIQRLVNAALYGEMASQLQSDKTQSLPNRRNGSVSKHLNK